MSSTNEAIDAQSTESEIVTLSQATQVRADVALIPNLYSESVVVDTLSLNDSYLTLEEGGFVRGVVIAIESRVIEGEFMQRDVNTGLPKPVDVVSLLIQTPEGEMIQMTNASAMLVGTVKDNISRGVIVPLKTPIQIMYLGKGDTKKKTRYDKWEIKLLSFGG